MYCQNCGNQIPDDAKFCKNCGFPTDSTQTDAGKETNKKSKHAPKLAIILPLTIIPLLLVVLATIYFWNPGLLNDIISGFNSNTKSLRSSVTDEGNGSISDYDPDNIPGGTFPPDILEAWSAQMDKYHEELKNEKSDIEGWSLYDKYAGGLHMENGSDTDEDGLTDKEEIEVYGSDPLKPSTAGDLYYDSYKVQNGMDLFKYAEYEDGGELVDDTGTITIVAKTPRDFDAKIIERTQDYSDNDIGVIEGAPANYFYAYEIDNYDGDTISVDLGPYADALGVSADDLDVEVRSIYSDNYETSRSNNTVTTNLGTPSLNASNGKRKYNVFIIDKNDKGTYVMSDKGIGDGDEIKNETEKYETNHSGIVCISDNEDVARSFWGASGLVEAHPGLFLVCSDDATEQETDALLAAGEYIYYLQRGKTIKLQKNDTNILPAERIVKLMSEEGRKFMEETSTFLGPDFQGGNLPKQTPGKGMVDSGYIWFSNDYLGNRALQEYMRNRDELPQIVESREKGQGDDQRFGLKDEFPFKNLAGWTAETASGKIEIGGVCAGMAQIAAEVYNYGSVQSPRGSSDSDNIGYDITSYDELSTLLDPELSDCVIDPDDGDDTSPAAQEMRTLLYCYWKKTNNIANSGDFLQTFYVNNMNRNWLKWETVENAINYLDDNKILLWYFNLDNKWGNGHCVNLVSYDRKKTLNEDGKMQESVIFDVYDSNYPQSLQMLQCIKYEVPDEPGENIVYFKYTVSEKNKNGGLRNAVRSSFLDSEEYYYVIKQDDTADNSFIAFAIFDDKGKCLNVRY